jgi:hypothetical protein
MPQLQIFCNLPALYENLLPLPSCRSGVPEHYGRCLGLTKNILCMVSVSRPTLFFSTDYPNYWLWKCLIMCRGNASWSHLWPLPTLKSFTLRRKYFFVGKNAQKCQVHVSHREFSSLFPQLQEVLHRKLNSSNCKAKTSHSGPLLTNVKQKHFSKTIFRPIHPNYFGIWKRNHSSQDIFC